jgi:hypothetical protein
MHWGVFAILAAHLYQNYLEEPPNPRETSERMNFNVIDKKQLKVSHFVEITNGAVIFCYINNC